MRGRELSFQADVGRCVEWGSAELTFEGGCRAEVERGKRRLLREETSSLRTVS